MQEIIGIVSYLVLGIVLMQAGIVVIDLVIPCDFPEEIKKRNTAVGYISAGTSISIGLILRSAIISKEVTAVSETLLQGIGSTALYFGIGMVCLVVGYLSLLLFNRKYHLDKEIGEANPAAGLMVMGFFIGIATVISGVIY